MKTTVEGMPRLNFPDICTDEPVFGQAFCKRHCTTAVSKGIPTDLKKYLQFLDNVDALKHNNFNDNKLMCLVYYTGSDSSLSPEECTSTHHPIALAQGRISILHSYMIYYKQIFS